MQETILNYKGIIVYARKLWLGQGARGTKVGLLCSLELQDQIVKIC